MSFFENENLTRIEHFNRAFYYGNEKLCNSYLDRYNDLHDFEYKKAINAATQNYHLNIVKIILKFNWGIDRKELAIKLAIESLSTNNLSMDCEDKEKIMAFLIDWIYKHFFKDKSRLSLILTKEEKLERQKRMNEDWHSGGQP